MLIDRDGPQNPVPGAARNNRIQEVAREVRANHGCTHPAHGKGSGGKGKGVRIANIYNDGSSMNVQIVGFDYVGCVERGKCPSTIDFLWCLLIPRGSDGPPEDGFQYHT